jgi:pilus assembly protein CpaC
VSVVVNVGLDGARVALKALLPHADIELKAVNRSIMIAGSVRSAEEAANAATVVRRFVQNDAEVINMLRVLGDQQVLLKVRIAEVQRTALKVLGSSFDFAKTVSGRTISGFVDGASLNTADAFGAVFVDINKLGFQSATFSALESRGLAKILAEPALVAISGETANFLAGGEFPIPVSRDDDEIAIVFKKFGVSLSFTPVVLASNKISLRINTEVSRLDSSEEILISGTSVKGLSVRRADSTVSLASGGSLMIAGLIQNDIFSGMDGLPWLKDIPILGTLFRSARFQNNQSELVIMVTAYLARQVDGEGRLSLPTDGFVPASDFDMFLMGQLYKRYGKRPRPDRVPMVNGPIGYIME